MLLLAGISPCALPFFLADAAIFSQISGICWQLYTRVGVDAGAATLDVLPGNGTYTDFPFASTLIVCAKGPADKTYWANRTDSGTDSGTEDNCENIILDKAR